MEQLNKCAARYDENTVIYKRCNRYTVAYRNSARPLWKGRGCVVVYDRETGRLIEYSTSREYMEKAFRRLPDGEDMPEIGYGISNY